MKDPRNLLIVALVGALAFLLGHASRSPVALGQGYPGGTGDSNDRMIAVTGTIGSGVSVLWVIDTIDQHLSVYQCRGGKSIELVAARNIEWDLQIEEYHDESAYSPSELRRQHLLAGREGSLEPEQGPTEPKEAPETGKDDK